MQETPETWILSLGQKDILEEGKATHSSILAWRIPWTEEPGGIQSTGLQIAGQDWSTQFTEVCSLELREGLEGWSLFPTNKKWGKAPQRPALSQYFISFYFWNLVKVTKLNPLWNKV